MIDNFPAFSAAVHARYNDMAHGELFVVDVNDIFESYLAAFPEGTNPMFRERTEHDCTCCKHFIRNLGRLVSIDGDQVSTIWDAPDLPHPYDVVAKRLDELVRQAPIVSVYRTKERQYGNEKTRQITPDLTTITWNHFYGVVANQHFSHGPDADRGQFNIAAQVMRRGLDELLPSAFESVTDLIDANALYRGAEFKGAVTAFRHLQRRYEDAPDKNLFVWENVGDRSALFRNTVIGTLITDLSAGVDLEDAVRKFESKVAPTNYKRPTALITPKMIDDAVTTLKDLGLEGAIHRRFARLSDVSVNDVQFVDNSVQSDMRDGIAGLLMEEVRSSPSSRADKLVQDAEFISAEDFFATVVPHATSIDLLVQNKHFGNFVSLTGGDGPERLFKWDNNFAWSYDGEVTDSIRQRVKKAGGNIHAKLRVSLAWSNRDDLDIHSHGPDGHVYFADKQEVLDVDMNAHSITRDPVENLAWTASRLEDGIYNISVNNYNKRDADNFGFTLEVESAGRVEQFTYDKAIPNNATVQCLTLTVKNGELVDLKVVNAGLVGGTASIGKWGISTETLVPVDTLMLSPNYWGEQAIGNKHWFFILKGCRNPDPVRGIYNEFLRSDLDKHRKVFEVLGSKTKCEPSDDQLSGLGFSSTRGDSVVAVVKGKRINKAYTINF